MTQPPPSTGDPGLADTVLVQRVAEGDPGALEAIYGRYGRVTWALARRITTDDGFAEDVVQEVFLALWRNPSGYDPDRGGFASWLLSMTHHRAVDAVRREESLRRRRTRAAEDAASALLTQGEGPSVHEEVWVALRRERVRDALRELPESQREALGLAYFGGYTQREVAALTGAPLGTVKTRMLAGMRRLRERLGGMEVAEGGQR